MVAPLCATMQESAILQFYYDMRSYKMKGEGAIAIFPTSPRDTCLLGKRDANVHREES